MSVFGCAARQAESATMPVSVSHAAFGHISAAPAGACGRNRPIRLVDGLSFRFGRVLCLTLLLTLRLARTCCGRRQRSGIVGQRVEVSDKVGPLAAARQARKA